MNATPNESEKQEAGAFDISFLDLYQLLELFVALLSDQTWRYIGLRVDPRTNELQKDLEKAQTAIDCIIFIVDKLEPHVTENVTNRLRTLLTDLQLNFARQSGHK